MHQQEWDFFPVCEQLIFKQLLTATNFQIDLAHAYNTGSLPSPVDRTICEVALSVFITILYLFGCWGHKDCSDAIKLSASNWAIWNHLAKKSLEYVFEM